MYCYLVACIHIENTSNLIPGRIVQPVTCPAEDTCLTADLGVASLIPVRSHTFVEIDHEIISTIILIPSTDSRNVSYKRKHMHKLLVNCLVKFAPEKGVDTCR